MAIEVIGYESEENCNPQQLKTFRSWKDGEEFAIEQSKTPEYYECAVQSINRYGETVKFHSFKNGDSLFYHEGWQN